MTAPGGYAVFCGGRAVADVAPVRTTRAYPAFHCCAVLTIRAAPRGGVTVTAAAAACRKEVFYVAFGAAMSVMI